MAVGALDRAGRAAFSNFGPWVDASTPGVDVVSTFFNDVRRPRRDGELRRAVPWWARWSGTSFAAPKVAGVIAQELYLHGGTAHDAWSRIRPAPASGSPISACSSTADRSPARRPARCHDAAVIVDAASYVEGRRILETDSIEKLAAERGGTGFGWLGLRMPSEPSSTRPRRLRPARLAIADARHKHDRPRSSATVTAC